jgi:hypothetical protein
MRGNWKLVTLYESPCDAIASAKNLHLPDLVTQYAHTSAGPSICMTIWPVKPSPSRPMTAGWHARRYSDGRAEALPTSSSCQHHQRLSIHFQLHRANPGEPTR